MTTPNGDAPGEAAATGFPVRVAAVDVGSNAIRFVAAEFDDATHWRELAYERFPVRLGHGAFLSGQLTETAVERALEAFVTVRGYLDDLGIENVRAVATSAVRESRNGPDFVRRVRELSGITLGLISGGEEARLVWHAVRNRVDFGTSKWMLVDLGGGSVEVSLADDNGILWSESHTMGSVRLLEELAEASDAPGHFSSLLAEYAATLRIPAAARHWMPVEVIATGGNIETLAQLAGPRLQEDGVPILTRTELRKVIRQLSRLSYAQRVSQLGLREDRADVILPAAIVYDRVAELAGAERIRSRTSGSRRGFCSIWSTSSLARGRSAARSGWSPRGR